MVKGGSKRGQAKKRFLEQKQNVINNIKAIDPTHFDKPELKERISEYQKEYRQKPEVKKRISEYRQRPEVKERISEYNKEYYQRSKE